MPWKPKEKELSIEQALKEAKSEAYPYWNFILPQFVAVQDQSHYSLYPLDPTFGEKFWMLLIVEPSCFHTRPFLSFFEEYTGRYRTIDMGFLIIFRNTDSSLLAPELFARYLQERGLKYPCVLDYNGFMSQCFNLHTKNKSGFFIYSEGKILFESTQLELLPQFESKLQHHLRSKDPGLPLAACFVPQTQWVNDKLILTPESKSEILQFHGIWEIKDSGWFTRDPQARLQFHTPHLFVSFFCGIESKPSEENSKIQLEILESPVLDLFAGKDLTYDDEGHSTLRIRNNNLYELLKELSPDQRSVVVRFPQADKVPVCLHSIHFGESIVWSDSNSA